MITVPRICALAIFAEILICGCDQQAGVDQSTHSVSRNLPTRTVEDRSGRIHESIATTQESSSPWFEDVSDRTRIQFSYSNGREAQQNLMIESFGGGVAAIDFDRDGFVDLFFTGGGTISRDLPIQISGNPSGFFRNLGEWAFFDATSSAMLSTPPDYSQGCAVVDFNADGFQDLFVCCYGQSRLYANVGDGTFRDVTTESLPSTHDWFTAAAFADWDGDGLPDLFVARYTDWNPKTDVTCFDRRGKRDLCGPTSYPGTGCRYFVNLGDGAFRDETPPNGALGNTHGLGVLAGDLNLDGRIDFYVSSDALPNHLYLGNPDHQFRETAMQAGVAVGEWGQPEASMGIDCADYNGDGLPDLFVSNYEKEDHALYRNLSDGSWMHSSVSTGLSATSRIRVGFGTSLIDFDGDGWPDLFVLNGHPLYTSGDSPYSQTSQLFRNQEGKRFVEITSQGGSFFRESYSGRGSAVADLDNDGDEDLICVLMNAPVRVLENRNPVHSFVSIDVRATHGERDAIGARVSVDFNGIPRTRFVVRGNSFFSQPSTRFVFATDPGSETTTATVVWPGRQKEIFRQLPTNQLCVLVEGTGEPSRDSN